MTTTLAPPTTQNPCAHECSSLTYVPIGVEDGRIADSNITTNSIRDSTPGSSYTGPEEARLNNQPSSSGSGAWEPKDDEAYLQIVFNKVEHVKEIRTQGSPSSQRYTARFYLMSSMDGENFEVVKVGILFILLLLIMLLFILLQVFYFSKK